MSTKGRIVLLIVGFVLEVSSAAESIQIHNSSISVTSGGAHWADMFDYRVNDGLVNNEGKADDCGCCAALQRPAWVKLTLDKTYLVEKILVLGRTDQNWQQFEDIKLFLTSQDQSLQLVAFDSKNRTDATTILNPPREVYTVRVSTEKTTPSHMTICEIMIYRQADCLPGKYSANCSKECHCLSGPCESITGTCMNAECKNGWRGLACNETCKPGTFGVNCTNVCHCHNNAACHHIDGTCPFNQCAAGWTNDNCSIACDQGNFGENCSSACHCLPGVSCNHVSGHCVDGQCAPGWSQSNCSLACAPGMFGKNCLSRCHCLLGASCDNMSGYCWDNLCAPGWTKSNCSVACDPDQFGNNCSFPCHCLHKERCDHITGHCPYDECAPGWTLRNCSVACGHDMYGLNCSSTCHCLSGASCDHVSGNCSDGLCAPGWTESNCSVACGQGLFGVNCSSPCHCLPGASCDHVSGKCSDDQCSPGWTESNCSVACKSSFYGHSCAQDCHCDTCHHVNGSCLMYLQCHDGYRMDNGFCTPCDQWLFGLNCYSPCHCLPGSSCDHVSGNCSDDLCEPGWERYCFTCKSGFYGQSCSKDCHCDECHHINGSCVMSLQCHNGFRMENGFCSPHEPIGGSTTFNVAGVVGGCIAAVVIIIGITLSIVYYRRRKLYSAKGHTKLSTPVKIETRVNEGFNHIDRANDGKDVSAEDKAEVASKNVIRLLSGTFNPIPCDDNDYYSFKTLSPGIKINELWDYIHEKCQRGSTFFEEEFNKLRSGLIHKHDIASSEENKGKNRYKQMYAYDHNRVPLAKKIDGDSEYINASFIHGFEKAKKFIASQGTTEKNLDDFWRMIWQQRVDKIVMLTNLVENVTVKCLQYWPEELNGVCRYGGIDVKYIDVEEMFDYNIRTFTITKGHDARVVKQFHLKSWPDKGVPETAWCLVDFWRAVDTQEEHQSPILVHCSAGVGRTGTFIALDNLISQAKVEHCVRPFQIVEALREQRVSMVQTKEQYAYLHEALAEALLVGTHHVVTRQFESVYNYMIGKDNISTTTRLEQQLELLIQSVDSRERHLQPVASQEAEYGNIGAQVAEIDAYRPQQYRRSELPDEINLPTFNAKTGVIVLHKPTENQLPKFWCRLDQLGSITVIDLASDDLELKHVLIDRLDGVHATKGPSVIKEAQQNGLVEITYSMAQETCRDKTIKHFVLSSWKGADIPTDKKALLEMIEAVHTWQSEMTDDIPILILDNGGYRKCGVVAVVLNEIFRILVQNGQINIVESVKTMVQGNSLLIRNKMQLKFCYDVIFDYVQQKGVYQNY